MNDSQVCLTTHVELANTNSLYRDWKKMDTKTIVSDRTINTYVRTQKCVL